MPKDDEQSIIKLSYSWLNAYFLDNSLLLGKHVTKTREYLSKTKGSSTEVGFLQKKS
jgi:hypothetical protein